MLGAQKLFAAEVVNKHISLADPSISLIGARFYMTGKDPPP